MVCSDLKGLMLLKVYDSFHANEFVSSTAQYPYATVQAYTSSPGSGLIYYTDTLFPPLTIGPVTTATFANSLLQIAAPRKLNPHAEDWSFGRRAEIRTEEDGGCGGGMSRQRLAC
jgi:hypothetical protein